MNEKHDSDDMSPWAIERMRMLETERRILNRKITGGEFDPLLQRLDALESDYKRLQGEIQELKEELKRTSFVTKRPSLEKENDRT